MLRYKGQEISVNLKKIEFEFSIGIETLYTKYERFDTRSNFLIDF